MSEPPKLALEAAAGLKLALAFGLIVFTVMLPRHLSPVYLAPAGVLLAAWLLCRMPFWKSLKRLAFAEVFIIGVALLSLVNPPSRPLVLSAIAKSNLCVIAMLLLTWTTPFQDLLHTLRRFGLPSIMVTTLALMSRYLPVMVDESRRMQRARASRTFASRQRLQWTSLAEIIAQLFLRSADRAERIYLAMCSRGWK